MDMHALFNQKLLDFADDLQAVKANLGANVPEIDAFRPAVAMASSFDPQKPQQLFNEHVGSKYDKQIAQKDEQFFLTERYQDMGEMNLVELLKRLWKTLSPQNKHAIWQHLQVLVVLNKKCLQQSSA